MRILDRWTLTASAALIVAALLACKKKEEAPPPVDTAPPPPTASAEPPAQDAATTNKKDVTRYGDKEKDESGTVKVKTAMVKVYREADESTDFIATLGVGTMVNRKARYGNWMLVDWPSGPGELSPGWVMTKYLDDKILTVDLNQLKNQDAGVQINDAAVAVVETPDAAAATGTPDATAAVVEDAGAAPATTDAGAAPTTTDAGSGGGRLKLFKKAAEALEKK